MRLLLDTQLVLFLSIQPERVSAECRDLVLDNANEVAFSVINLWEIAIKRGLGRPDFQYDPRVIRRWFISENYTELPVSGEHALAVENLPPIHRDPFDRLLIAQAASEGLTLLTTDGKIASYPGDIRRV